MPIFEEIILESKAIYEGGGIKLPDKNVISNKKEVLSMREEFYPRKRCDVMNLPISKIRNVKRTISKKLNLKEKMKLSIR